MKYNPQDALDCLPEGEYDATIEKAEETTSKAGKEMVVLTYRVYGSREATVKDYITEKALFKLKRVAKAIGQEAAFESGVFKAADYEGRNLRLSLIVKTDDYGDKNEIRGYMASQLGGKAKAAPLVEDSDIPF